MLLAILRQDDSLAKRFKLSRDLIIHEAEGRRLPPNVDHQDLPISEEFKRIMGYAAQEAEWQGSRAIYTSHLFVGIFREEECYAAEILRKSGLTLEAARKTLGIEE